MLLALFVCYAVLIICVIPMSGLVGTIFNLATGRYLNRYYMFSRKRDGSYELHCNPWLGFFYALPETYFRKREEAVAKFRKKHPHAELFAVTSTLQRYYSSLGYVGEPAPKRPLSQFMNYFLVCRNFANYRKRNEQEWQIAHLFRRIKQTTPLRYRL